MSNNVPTSSAGISGWLAQLFVHSKITPVVAVASVLLGLGAVWLTPKEEEPQISVPMIDIQTPAPGLDGAEIVRHVTEPIERAVWGLDGVEYVYSTSTPHHSLVTVRFKVGEPIEPSLVKVHHKLLAVRGELPAAARQSEVKSYSIDDVPFLTLTFSSNKRDDYSLRTLVAPLARQLSSTPDLSRVELLGGLKRSVRVVADPETLRRRGVSLLALATALQKNDAYAPAGKTWSPTQEFDVEVGGRLKSAADIGAIPIGQKGGAIVRVSDVARVVDGPEARVRQSVLLEKGSAPAPAVSIVFAKRKGTNVVTLTGQLLNHAEAFAKELPGDVKMSVMRNYGETAYQKSMELIEHLLIATLSVSLLIALFMGLRAALVVGIAIPVTLALTLATYYLLGYTLNRVTLFALIFSIGILVDDAIVVVENIERHLKLKSGDSLLRSALNAVAEVGNPTILATFTVVAAILPMAFVRGLMGPYMRPIPVGASLAMLLSLVIAFTVTPWAAVRLLKRHAHPEETPQEGRMDRAYRWFMNVLLSSKPATAGFGLVVVALLAGAGYLIVDRTVKVKMLPFDNKNEFQVLVDYPTSTPLAQSTAWSVELAQVLLKDPNVVRVQVYGGEAAPYSFSGMVKHTFLRQGDWLNDLQVVLKPKDDRKEASHEIIEKLRPGIAAFGKSKGALTKVLEIPPGPPVLATVLAEVYGPDEKTRNEAAQAVYRAFAREPSVVDLDQSSRPGRQRQVYSYDWNAGGLLGTKSAELVALGQMVFSESPVAVLDDAKHPEPVAIQLSVSPAVRSGSQPFAGQLVPSFESGMVSAGDLLQGPRVEEQRALHRKNLKPVTYVMSELSGAEESPVYGIAKISPNVPYPTQTLETPWDTSTPMVKWDGEWFITFEVFRDLGLAFGAVMILIYVLVLGWFRSFSVPLVIMAPIPISLIGILPGHAALGAYFTATSMIGFIAGAGIIVRNSIILVDFVEHQLAQGATLKEAVIGAGVMRFRPMLLTAAAVVVGSAVMLRDPIFQGLAISLMFGEVAATLLSRAAVPLLYYWMIGKRRLQHVQSTLSLGA